MTAIMTRVRTLCFVGGMLATVVLAGCTGHMGETDHHASTPKTQPTARPAVSRATLKGVAARCGLRGAQGSTVLVKVYAWANRHSDPVALQTTNLSRRDHYRIRLRPGHYWVIAKGSADGGKAVKLQSGETKIVNFPNMCF